MSTIVVDLMRILSLATTEFWLILLGFSLLAFGKLHQNTWYAFSRNYVKMSTTHRIGDKLTMYLYETHMHTYPASACACNSPEEMVRHYKSKKYTGIIITDHFFNGNNGAPRDAKWEKKVEFLVGAYERAKKEGKKHDLDVFFGLEYSNSGSDFLVYGLDEEFLLKNPGFDELSLADFSATVRRAGGYLAQAHPFRVAWWITNPEPVHPSLIDGIEVHNSSMDSKANKQALDFAIKHNLPKQSGTDAHDTISRRPSGIALQKRAKNIFDIINAIKSEQVTLLN